MKRIKGLSLLLALMFIVLSVAGCTPKTEEKLEVEDVGSQENNVADETKSFPMEVEDIFGNKVTIEEEPTKIVSLAPSNTEILFALGLGDKVVGITSNCNFPAEATTKEVVGTYEGVNLERIIELEADLVLLYGPGDEGNNKILKDAGINVLGFMGETIESVIHDIETIGKATGKGQEATEIIEAMNSKKNTIVEKIKGQDEVTVFYEIWHDPLMAAGKGSFMDELITLAGGKNIAEDAEGAYPVYDLEQLVERDPEIYLASQAMDDMTEEAVKARPGFENISAVKNDRVYLFKGTDADVVSRPGPRIVDALEVVAKAIHPELFK